MQPIKWQSGGVAAADRIENAADANGFDSIMAGIDAIKKSAADAGDLAKPIIKTCDRFVVLWNRIASLGRRQERTMNEWGLLVEQAKQEAAARIPQMGAFGSPQDRNIAIARAQADEVTKAQRSAAKKVVEATQPQSDKIAAEVVDAQIELRRAYEAAIEEATGPSVFLDPIDDRTMYQDGVYEGWLRGRKTPISEAFTRWKSAVERDDEEEAIRIARVAMPLIHEWRQQPSGAIAKRYAAMSLTTLETERGAAFKFADAIDAWRRENMPRGIAIAARAINAFLELHALLLGEHAAFMSPIDFERLLNSDTRVPTEPLWIDPQWPFRFLPPSQFTLLRSE